MYRAVSLFFCVSFALVGLLFLFFPGGVIQFFNGLNFTPGLAGSPPGGAGFYQLLAVGYMYLVSVLAYLMYKHPTERTFPLLLINGKSATALLSIILFFAHGAYLIYAANAIVDGSIALVLIPFYLNLRRRPA